MGTILTFYSYKGGVGRSMAVANIAYLLATDFRKRVLVVDWDLEAPGLHRYFADCPGATIQPAAQGRGLIDLLISQARNEKPDWREYVSEVTLRDRQASLSLLHCGLQDEAYPSKVLGLDWARFFAESDGGAFIESLRNSWKDQFDFTLIDSRTGITDSGGICTIQLPDVIVPVFTTNEESLRGVVDVVERAQRARQRLAYDRSRLLVFPLPSRYDSRSQYKEARQWLEHFAEVLAPCYEDWLPKEVTPFQMIERTKLPYIGYFSFGTKMPVAIEGTSDPEGLGYAYAAAASLIANDFQRAAEIVSSPSVQDEGVASREELALLRMKRALAEENFEWRSIEALAKRAAIQELEALALLQSDPDIEFGRARTGRTIARIRPKTPVAS